MASRHQEKVGHLDLCANCVSDRPLLLTKTPRSDHEQTALPGGDPARAHRVWAVGLGIDQAGMHSGHIGPVSAARGGHGLDDQESDSIDRGGATRLAPHHLPWRSIANDVG